MSRSNSQGIQTLLEAEKEASLIVQKARDYRNQNLKQARLDAQNELSNLKSLKDEEFNKNLEKSTDTQSNHKTKVEEQTTESINELNALFDKNKLLVIDKLLDRVVKTDNKLHQNVKKI